MIFLLSGEGPTDLGRNVPGSGFEPGPMAVLTDILAFDDLQYSVLEAAAVEYLSKSDLKYIEAQLKASPNPRHSLRGKKRGIETGFFFTNARALAHRALQMERDADTPVVAILFRDSDGTNSTPGTLWQDKLASVMNGFAAMGFTRGVPMLPKPKSEAWLLCCKQTNRDNCTKYERASGNDASPKSLKRQLEAACGDVCDCEVMTQIVQECCGSPRGRAKLETMPSFRAFADRLAEILDSVT